MDADDHRLLERYFKLGDHGAFTDLARRYFPLVHSAACRLSQNQSVAEEISQIVMSKLAGLRVMPPLSLPLSVWMHRTTRSVSIDLLRADSRRRCRERIFAMHCEPAHTDFPWDNIAPVLDEVISQLADKERSVLLGRFFMGQSHAAIAESLNLSEDAVRMRVARALEKLGGLLRKRGIATTASALGFGLSAHAVTPVSSGLVSSISAAALVSVIPATFCLTAMTFKTVAISAVILLMSGTGVLVYQKLTTPHRQEISGTAASPSELPVPVAEPEPLKNVSYFDKPRNPPKKIEIDNWLDRRGRSPRNLIAAAALGGAEDKRLILESLENNPNDPATLMRVLQHDLLPQRTGELYESLRRNAPNNKMPYLLEAARLLAAGKSEAALAALLSAAQRPEFDSYIKGIKGDAELMLRDMGRDELAAAALSTLGISDPVLEEIGFRLSTTEATKSTPLLIAAHISALEALSANPTTVSGKYSSISHLYDLINQSKNYAVELGPYLDRPFNDYNDSIWQQRMGASKYIHYLTDPKKILAAFPVDTQVDFFRRASKLGEVDAVDWLLSTQSMR